MQPFALSVLRQFGRAQFIPWGVRDRVLRHIFPPEAQCNLPFVADINGARYCGNAENFIDWVIYFFGQYERGLLRLIAQLIGKDAARHCFWDVGANAGQHSLFVAAMGARVEAFEPWPAMLERIRNTMRLNPQLAITLHPFGLSNEDATLPYAEPSGVNLGGGSFLPTAQGERRASLPLRRGDDLALPAPTIIKIDVEGYEPRVLEGLAITIATHRPIIIAEFSGGTATELRGRSFRSLLPAGYSFQRIAGAERPQLRPFEHVPDGSNILCLPIGGTH